MKLKTLSQIAAGAGLTVSLTGCPANMDTIGQVEWRHQGEIKTRDISLFDARFCASSTSPLNWQETLRSDAFNDCVAKSLTDGECKDGIDPSDPAVANLADDIAIVRIADGRRERADLDSHGIIPNYPH